MVGIIVAQSIAMMRCAHCGVPMRQGEREVSPQTTDGRPLHSPCAIDRARKESR